MPEEAPPPPPPPPDRIVQIIRTDAAAIVPAPRNTATVSAERDRRATVILG